MVRRRSQECERIRAWVSADLDSELSEFETTLVRTHLSGCEGCREFGADVFAFTKALRAAPLERMSYPVALPRRRRLVLQPLRLSAAAGAIIAVAAGGLFASIHSRDVLSSSQKPVSARALIADMQELQAFRTNTALARTPNAVRIAQERGPHPKHGPQPV
jgi:predicted anti-sigma-YlaC factor YlaD